MNKEIAGDKSRRVADWLTLLKIVLVAFAIIVILPIAFLTYKQISLDRDIEALLNQIRAEGYPATLDEVQAEYDAARSGEQHNDYLEAIDCSDVDYSEWPLFCVYKTAPNEMLPEPTLAEMEKLFQAEADLFQFLKDHPIQRGFRYPLAFEEGENTDFDDNGYNIFKAHKLFVLESVYAASKGDTPRAFQALVSALSITVPCVHIPCTESICYQLYCYEFFIDDLGYILPRARFSDEQLAELDEWLKLAKGMPLADIIARESAIARTQIYQRITSDAIKATRPYGWPVYRYLGAFKADYLYMIHTQRRYEEVFRKPYPVALIETTALDEEIMQVREKRIWRLTFHPITSDEDYRLCVDRLNDYTRKEACLSVARAAIAIERYRLKHGKFPEKLSELSPGFIDAVPQDPFVCRPLQYYSFGNGYLVYSVGSDCVDQLGLGEDDHAVIVAW